MSEREMPTETLSPMAASVEEVLAAYRYELVTAIEAIDEAVPGYGGLFEPGTSDSDVRAGIEAVLDARGGASTSSTDATLSDGSAILYVDGSSRGNPGPAGAGAVIQDGDGEAVLELGCPVGSQSGNNTAEYVALYLGLTELLARFDPARLEVRIDSMTVIRSVWDQQVDPGPNFREYQAPIIDLLDQVPHDEWTHLADSDPNPADALATVGADIAALGPGG